MPAANTRESKVNRILRRQRELEQQVKSLVTVMDHCQRLIREKETLQRQLDAARTVNRGLAEANRYMATPRKIPTLSVTATGDFDCNCKPGYPHDPDCNWWDRKAAVSEPA